MIEGPSPYLQSLSTNPYSPPEVLVCQPTKSYGDECASPARHAVLPESSASDYTDLANMPFLRSQILREEPEDEKITQGNVIREFVKTKTAGKGILTSATQSQENHRPIRSSKEASHQLLHAMKATSILKTNKPTRLSRPRDPKKLQSALHLMSPKILYVKYNCAERCRSVGVCVHFSFLVTGKALPDGLICQMCNESGCEDAFSVSRICKKHSAGSNSTVAHPEDDLAQPQQVLAAADFFRKAWTCDWDSVSAHEPAQNLVSAWQPLVTEQSLLGNSKVSLPNTYTSHPAKKIKIWDKVADSVKWSVNDQTDQTDSYLDESMCANTQDRSEYNGASWPSLDEQWFTENDNGGSVNKAVFPSPKSLGIDWLFCQPLKV